MSNNNHSWQPTPLPQGAQYNLPQNTQNYSIPTRYDQYTKPVQQNFNTGANRL